MPGSSYAPSTHKKNTGYFFASLNHLINGFDNGSGYVKIPFWIMGIAITAVLAPYIILGGAVFALLNLSRGIHEEKERNQKENELIELRNKQVYQLRQEEELAYSLLKAHTMKNDPSIIQKKTQQFALGKSVKDIETVLSPEVQTKIEESYPSLAFRNQGKADAESNKALLIKLLKDYFALLKDNEVPQDRKLPKQTKMLALIKDVSGINPHHLDFKEKMNAYLAGDAGLQADFNGYMPDGYLASPAPGVLSRGFTRASAWFKRRHILRNVVKDSMDFLSDFGTGAGIAASMIILFGLLTAPLSLPLIGLMLGCGLAFGITNLIHSKVSGDRARRNMREVEKDIKLQKDKLELTKRLIKLTKIHDNREKLLKGRVIEADPDAEVEEGLPAEELPLLPLVDNSQPAAVIPKSVYARMAIGMVGRIIAAASIAMITAIGYVWLSAILLPALPILLPTLGCAGVLSLFYLYRGIKREYASIKSELTLIRQVAEAKQHLIKKHNNDAKIKADLEKDNVLLLNEVLTVYLDSINSQGGKAARHPSSGKYPKQEKIFRLIETTIGVNRLERPDGKAHATGDDLFFHQLAKFLKGKNKDSTAANALAQQFKNLFEPTEVLTNTPVNAGTREANQGKGIVKKLGSFFKDHLFSTVGVVALGLGLTLCLIGPQLLITTAVFAVVLVGYAFSRFAMSRAQKNKQNLAKETSKIELIDRKHKLIHHHDHALKQTQKRTPTVEDKVEKSEDQEPSPLVEVVKEEVVVKKVEALPEEGEDRQLRLVSSR